MIELIKCFAIGCVVIVAFVALATFLASNPAAFDVVFKVGIGAAIILLAVEIGLIIRHW